MGDFVSRVDRPARETRRFRRIEEGQINFGCAIAVTAKEPGAVSRELMPAVRRMSGDAG
jgi:hypothetical protein